MQNVFENIYKNLCYYSGREKHNKNTKKNNDDNLEDEKNSTKKEDLFECHACFLPLEEKTVEKIVKIKSKTYWFCSEHCYKEFISFPIGVWRSNILK